MFLDALKIFSSSQKSDYDVSLDLSYRGFTQLFESVGYFLLVKLGKISAIIPLNTFSVPPSFSSLPDSL